MELHVPGGCPPLFIHRATEFANVEHLRIAYALVFKWRNRKK